MDKTIHGRPLEKNTIPSFQLVIIETLTESEHALFYHSATSVGEGRKEMFYLTMHSTHFIYGYMASDMVKETRCHHMGYSFRLTARVLLYEPSYRQDSTYHSLSYTSRSSIGEAMGISSHLSIDSH